MKFQIGFLLLTTMALNCYGYSFVIPAKMSRPGVCFYNGVLLQRGDNQLPSACQNMRCNEDGSILVQGCGHFDLTDCTVVDPLHLDKPYPDCCKMNFLCATPDGITVNREVSPLQRRVYA